MDDEAAGDAVGAMAGKPSVRSRSDRQSGT